MLAPSSVTRQRWPTPLECRNESHFLPRAGHICDAATVDLHFVSPGGMDPANRIGRHSRSNAVSSRHTAVSSISRAEGPAPCFLGPKKHPFVLGDRGDSRPRLRLHSQFPGPRQGRSSDSRRCGQQFRWICQPGGGRNGRVDGAFLLDAPRRAPQSRTLDLNRPYRSHRLRCGSELFLEIQASGALMDRQRRHWTNRLILWATLSLVGELPCPGSLRSAPCALLCCC